MGINEKKRGPRIVRWMVLICFTIFWYSLIQVVSRQVFHVNLEMAALPGDLVAHLVLALICYSLSGRLSLALPAIACLIAALNLCNAGKIQFYGTPVTPDDFLALRNLFFLLTGWQLVGVVVIVFLPITLIFVMISWRQKRTWLLITVYSLGVMIVMHEAGLVVNGMDKVFKNSVWNQRGNFESRGVLIHIVQEALRHQARSVHPPSAEEVAAAMKALKSISSGKADGVALSAEAQARNVHMIVLESFWDPALLTGSGLSADPLDPRFRSLWRQAGNSHALSPVFGGFTANSEFEALCGLPVTEDHVFFETGLRNPVACLPQVLQNAGYRSVASHPNVAGFWNRVNAYRRIGFDTYWSDRDFILDDLNGEFLSDASLYRQVMAKIKPLQDQKKPVFDYILTYLGHVAYPLNSRRPEKITVTDKNALLAAYVNLMYYKSRELMDFLERLRKDDPDGVIVLFGDHLPFLGPGFYGFLRSKLLTDNRATMTDEMVYTLTATPLVIIDGRRGPVAVGDLPMYRLPALLLDLLGRKDGAALRLSASPGDAVIRPLPGMFWMGTKGNQKVCREGKEDSENCREAGQWLRGIITITRDLFSGRQYSLPELEEMETRSKSKR